jgi:hypothetical protein
MAGLKPGAYIKRSDLRGSDLVLVGHSFYAGRTTEDGPGPTLRRETEA